MEYSMSSAAAAAESDLQLFAGAPSLTEEAYREAASQLERRLMTSIPGIPMDPALAADLYAGSIQGLPEPGKAISCLHQGAVVDSDALARAGGGLALDGAAAMAGGCLFELRDAYRNPGAMSFWERIKRLFSVLFSNMKAMVKDKGPMELCTEAADAMLGLLSGMFRNLKTLLKTLSQGIQQLASEI